MALSLPLYSAHLGARGVGGGKNPAPFICQVATKHTKRKQKMEKQNNNRKKIVEEILHVRLWRQDPRRWLRSHGHGLAQKTITLSNAGKHAPVPCPLRKGARRFPCICRRAVCLQPPGQLLGGRAGGSCQLAILLVDEADLRVCCCSMPMDPLGNHALCCAKLGLCMRDVTASEMKLPHCVWKQAWRWNLRKACLCTDSTIPHWLPIFLWSILCNLLIWRRCGEF